MLLTANEELVEVTGYGRNGRIIYWQFPDGRISSRRDRVGTWVSEPYSVADLHIMRCSAIVTLHILRTEIFDERTQRCY